MNIRIFSRNITEGLTRIYNLTNYDFSTQTSHFTQNNSADRLSRTSIPFVQRKYELRGSPWVMPIASYEFPPAFFVWKAISKIVDLFCIRGLSGPPLTNLRWMATYSSTLCLMFVMAVLLLIMLGRS